MYFFLVGLSIYSLSTCVRLCAYAEIMMLLHANLTYRLWSGLNLEKVENRSALGGRDSHVLKPLYLVKRSAQSCLSLEGVELNGFRIIVRRILFDV